MLNARVYLDLSEETRTLLSDLNWECKGYLLADVAEGVALIDLKVAVALTAARSAPLFSRLKGIEIFALTAPDAAATTEARTLGFSAVLAETFQPLLELISDYLNVEDSALVQFNLTRRLEIGDVPTDVSLEIPVALLEAFDADLEFDRLVIETAEEIFYYSL